MSQPHDSAHPSAFALDLLGTSGESAGSVADHVKACAQCQAYVAQLQSLEAPPRAVPKPSAWPAPSRKPAQRTWVMAAASGLALAAAVALVVRARQEAGRDPYVAAKGQPAAEVWIEGKVGLRRWSAEEPVHAGDRVGIRVACSGYRWVTVTSDTSSGPSPDALITAPCEAEPFALAKSLTVDDAPGDEHLALVFSAEPLRGAPRADAYVMRLVLKKSDGRTP